MDRMKQQELPGQQLNQQENNLEFSPRPAFLTKTLDGYLVTLIRKFEHLDLHLVFVILVKH